ncbi:MAG: Maf family protein [Hyphomicrobiales bacterium]|nr:Maf family protein [Hyphomicrobiales bacterium]
MTSPSPLWIAGSPLVLASKSASRRQLLASAGLAFDMEAAEIDERAVEDEYFAGGGPVEQLALTLARAKALDVSARRAGALCLGADQTLSLEGRLFHKSATMEAAAEALAAMSGRRHRLTSAFALARDGRIVAEGEDSTDLTMRPLDGAAIARYLEIAGPQVLASVGVYQLEGLGVHLFEAVEGDHTTILGLPMLKLLACLRREGALAL